MEALLLTLDVGAMVVLCWLVRKAAQSKTAIGLGWFGYRNSAHESVDVKKTIKGSRRA